MSVDQFRARIAALQAEFETLDAQYRERYAYDFSTWEADDDQFDETIRGATALQAQFEALPGKVSALREELVGLVQKAEAGRDMAQSALDAAEAAVSEAEDLASDADQLEDGEFERDNLNDTVAELEARRRELMTGDGEKGVSRLMLKRKARPGNADTVKAFAGDPMDAGEAEQMWNEFVSWAEQFGESPRGDGTAQEYVESMRDDWNIAAPMGRAHAERAMTGYRRYIEDNYDRAKSAADSPDSHKAVVPTTAHKLYA